MHKLDGPCHCGADHSAGYRLDFTPARRAPDAPKKITRSHIGRNAPDYIHSYGEHLRLLRWGSGAGKELCWQHFHRDYGWIDTQGPYTPGFYRADEIMASDARKLVYLAGGEKCVDELVKRGAVAGCNPGGENRQWRDEWSELFRGRHVVILADADKTGRAHAEAIAAALTGVAASVRLLELEGAHDVADWLADGHTLLELLELVAVTPVKSNIDFTPEPTVPDDYETLKAQNRSLNEKLLWIYEVIRGRRLTHAQKCALIMVRKNSEWSVNEPRPSESEQSVKMRAQGFTPDTLGSLARDIGASEKSTGTVSKYLQVLRAEELIAVENFTETKTITKDDGTDETMVLPRLAYATLPAASQPKVYAQPKAEHQETRGGKRENSGRPAKICKTPGCGSEEFSPETTYRELHEAIVKISICKKCGKPHREVLRDEVIGREHITEDEIPDDGDETVKSNIDFTPIAPDEGSVTADCEIKESPPLDPYPANFDFTPECRTTGNAHVYAMQRDAKGRRVCIACQTPEESQVS